MFRGLGFREQLLQRLAWKQVKATFHRYNQPTQDLIKPRPVSLKLMWNGSCRRSVFHVSSH